MGLFLVEKERIRLEGLLWRDWLMHPWMARLVSGLMEPTVALSYGRPGIAVRRALFQPKDTDVDMRGKVCLVTGANSGIGFETARALAALGAEVWLLCRNRERGLAAEQAIRDVVPGAQVQFSQIDLSMRDSIEQFVEHHAFSRVDVLVHNAGVLPSTRQLTSDGLELTLATNLLGPFLLTHRLLPALECADGARVIHVSSGGMYTQKLNLEALWSAPEPFDGVVQYAQTKRGMVILNELWPQHAASSVQFHCMHPGWVDTPALRSSLPGFWKWMKWLLRDAIEGADTVIWLAVCPTIEENGAFWLDRERRRTHILPGTKASPDVRQALWDRCLAWVCGPV